MVDMKKTVKAWAVILNKKIVGFADEYEKGETGSCRLVYLEKPSRSIIERMPGASIIPITITYDL